MTTEPAAESKSPVAVSKRRLSRLQKVLLTFILLFAVVGVGLIAIRRPSNQVLLLTSDQFAQQAKPGPLAGLKNSVRNFAAPLWRRFRSPSPSIKVTGQLWTDVPSVAEEDLHLGDPKATNSTGLDAWILAAHEADILREQLKTNRSSLHLGANGFAAVNASGLRSSIFRGNPARPGFPFTGTTFDLIAKQIAGSIQLTLETRVTEALAPSTNALSVRTNFAAAFIATIPDGGCLVLEQKDFGEPDGKNYWMVVNVELLDAKGKRIRP